MTSPRILVLENHEFARNVLVRMLQRLSVRDVLQAPDAEQAMVQMHLQGGVDIVICDLTDRGLDCLEFLRVASHSGMVRAVLLCSELPRSWRVPWGKWPRWAVCNCSEC
ncbi:response regulator [Pseudomonas sp. S2_H08]